MAVHNLKTLPVFFRAVNGDLREGTKRFEVRKDDRGYKQGDVLHLEEWSQEGGYTGRWLAAYVSYLLRHEDYPEGIMPGYAVMSITEISSGSK